MSQTTEGIGPQLLEMQRRLDALEQRSARRRYSLTAVAIIALVFGAVTGRFGLPESMVHAQLDKGAVEVVCKALRVVDETGRTRVHLAYDKFGGIFRVNNAEGKPLVAVEVDPEGGFVSIASHDGGERAFIGVGQEKSGGLVYLKDPAGKHRGYFGISKEGYGGLTFTNPQGKNEVFLGTSLSGWGGLLNLNGPDGKSRIIMDVTKAGTGAVEMLNNNQKSEVYLGSSAKSFGGLLNLNAPSGVSGVILDVDGNSWGRLNLRDNDGKMFLFAGADQDGGALRAYGHDNRERAFFGVGDKQTGGLIYLLNPDNDKARTVIGVDGAGVGYVEGRDDAGLTKRALR